MITNFGCLTNDSFTLVELLRQRALQQPHDRAYTFLAEGETEKEHLAFAELDRRARAIGAVLRSLVAAGERALLLYSPGLNFIAAFFGCLYAEVVAVPVYPPDPARMQRTLPRLRAIVNDARPLIVLTTSSILSMAETMFGQDSDLRAIRWLTTDQVASDRAEEWQDPGVSGHTLAFLQYTSGSTAAPKGVMVSHANLMYNLEMLKKGFDHSDQPRFVSWLPLFHDMGLIGAVLHSIYVGAPCVLMSPVAFVRQPIRWLKAITRYKATFSGGPNFSYDLCARRITPEERETLDLSSWENAFNGAEPVRHRTLERFTTTFEPCGFRREAFYPCYGLAEVTLFASGGLKPAPPVFQAVLGQALERDQLVAVATEDEGARILVGCGRTWLGQKILIVDPDSLTPCPPDRIGEIWISGPNVAQGYWNRPEETADTFQVYLADTGEGPFLRTGDLGFLKDGELFITGRLKDLIIIHGLNYYPQDIELTVEQSHPALRPGGCAGFSIDVNNQERLVIVAEVGRRYRPDQRQEQMEPASGSAGGLSLDIREVVRAVQRAVAQCHGLQIYDLVLLKAGSIPKTSSGKIQRHACRADYLAGALEVWG